MEPTIVVIGEHDRGQIQDITYQAASFARQLAQSGAYSLKLVLLGDQAADEAEMVSEQTGLEVVLLKAQGFSLNNSETIKAALVEFLSSLPLAYLCLGHTAQGMDIAPGLAVRLGAAHISGVQGIGAENGKLYFLRAILSGKQIAWAAAETRPVILNILPGRFKPEYGALNRKPAAPRIVTLRLEDSGKIRFLNIKASAADHTGLTEADVIVAAGNGLGDQENLELIFQLAKLFPKSAVGGSRIICDRGWLDYGCQVGVTGATVAPKLYIACGVSGASQHLAGMSGAEFIVAINTDPQAPIMRVADVGVIEDLRVFIPELLRASRKDEI